MNIYDKVATAHRINGHEAIDEVQDAIEILFAREDRPEGLPAAWQEEAILRYIDEQYRTNRRRL
jgi:hypothetical protein